MEPLSTVSETGKTNEQSQPLPLQLITPPSAYQCLGTKPLPSAPQLQQQTSQIHEKIPSYEIPQIVNKQPKQSTPYEIPPTTINNPTTLTPSVKLMEKQNTLLIDFEQLTPNTTFISLLIIMIS